MPRTRPSTRRTGTLKEQRSEQAGGDDHIIEDQDAHQGEEKFPPRPSSSKKTSFSNSDNPARAKKRRKPNKRTIPSSPESEPSKVALTSEWPQHFKDLQRIYQALNTVFTFCSARKHLHTTIENMKSSIEGLLKSPLQLESIAQIKTLLPHLIRFTYVDKDTLGAVESMSGPKRNSNKDLNIYRIPQASTSQPVAGPQEVLLFQFLDGELKTQSHKLPSRRKKPTPTTLSPQELLMPTYSPKLMLKMVEKRNLKFKEAVNELLLACAAEDPAVDPVELLIDSAVDYVPINSLSAVLDQKSVQDHQSKLDYYLENPAERPSIESLLAEIKADPGYRNQIVENGERATQSREATFRDLKSPLSRVISEALNSTKKITCLYSHQTQAIDLLADGLDVVVSTSTSSGKSLVYQVPMLQALEADPSSCGLYIFPTKALAQDQKRSLDELIYGCGESFSDVRIATFDGDTAAADRPGIRDQANIIFTNPDMLHLSILPHEELWRRFFRNLKVVVVDELHTYAGLFGCHVALIMRRLRRVCEAIGNSQVRFVSCSATILNPVEHMKTMFSLEHVELVSEDGAPSGAKRHVIWNPPLLDDKDPRLGRLSPIVEGSRILRLLITKGIRTIVFCRIRKTCELLMKQIGEDLIHDGQKDLIARVRSYRSGYTAQERRLIEQEMFSGKLLGIVATTALELGVDIGSLDAVITLGFPHSLSGLRQQAGRAGRRNKESLAMLILDQGALDQHFARNPDQLFDARSAPICLDLDNEIILASHLQCAANEIPVDEIEDQRFFGARLPGLCQQHLISDGHGFYHCHPRFKPSPSQHVSIRALEDESYSIVDTTRPSRPKILEEMESSRVMFECHEGAIYIHQGRTFQVFEVDHQGLICKIREAAVDWVTRPRELTEVDTVETISIRPLQSSSAYACYGTVKITTSVFGYVKLDRRKNVMDTYELENKPLEKHSKGIWIEVSPMILRSLREHQIDVATAIHSAEHALLSFTFLFAMSVAGDLKTLCRTYEHAASGLASGATDRLVERKRPTRLIIFDSAGKCGGICAKAFDKIEELVERATEALSACGCTEGCPSCITRLTCPKSNLEGAKFGASIVLNGILGRVWVPDQIESNAEGEQADSNGQ